MLGYTCIDLRLLGGEMVSACLYERGARGTAARGTSARGTSLKLSLSSG